MSEFSKAIFGFHLLSLIAYGLAYSYNDIDSWGHYSATCGEGKNQSPIDLRANVTQVDKLPIEFINYTLKPKLLKIRNNGHTVSLTAEWDNEIPIVTGKLVNGEKFRFAELHVHWSSDKSGSEHAIDGRRYAIEAHFVHFNVKYKRIQDALGKKNGLLVIGLPAEVNDNQRSNTGMILLSSLFSTVAKKNCTVDSTVFDISLFNIDSIDSFYTYSGSLTTPPCTENVRWVVSSKPLSIEPYILKSFRSIQLDDGAKTNVRPLQELNNRKVILYQLNSH